jgi:hypothetical protein
VWGGWVSSGVRNPRLILVFISRFNSDQQLVPIVMFTRGRGAPTGKSAVQQLDLGPLTSVNRASSLRTPLSRFDIQPHLELIAAPCRLRSQWIAIREKVRLEFRADALNLFNWVNFGPPVSNVGDPGFAIISSPTTSPRTLQPSLKLSF